MAEKNMDKKRKLSRRLLFDLPLHKKEGSGFLIWMIGFMIFLACMATAGYIALNQMILQWQMGVQGHVTVQISAISQKNGKSHFLTHDELRQKARQVEVVLKQHRGIETVRIVPMIEIQQMVAPWLHFGQSSTDAVPMDLPLPGLVTAQFNEEERPDLKLLAQRIKDAVPEAKLDTHKEWLEEFLYLLSRLRMIALILTASILCTAILAIAGASRSRLAMHFPEIELLHLMGANDNYIARQFQWHAVFMALQGGALGLFTCGLTMLAIKHISTSKSASTLNLDYQWTDMALITTVPLLGCIFALHAAKWTTLRFLKKLP